MAIVSSITVAQWDRWVREEHADQDGITYERTHHLGQNETPEQARTAYAIELAAKLAAEEIERELS